VQKASRKGHQGRIHGAGSHRRENEQKSNDPNDHGTLAAHQGEYMNRQPVTGRDEQTGMPLLSVVSLV
jgi:hypothetical protein